MAGGPIGPNSVSLDAGLASYVYVPRTNTNLAGQFSAYSVPVGLLATAALNLQFNMPEVIPTGTPKLRLLAEANATTGTVNLVVSDGAVSVPANIGAVTLTAEAPTAVSFTVPDTLVDTKVTLSTAATANQLLVVRVAFQTTSTLAQIAAVQPTLIWE